MQAVSTAAECDVFTQGKAEEQIRENAIICGPLQKQGPRFRGWKPRFAVLNNNHLRWFEDTKCHKPMGALYVSDILSVQERESDGDCPIFHIITSERRYPFKAESQEQCGKWTEAVCKTAACSKLHIRQFSEQDLLPGDQLRLGMHPDIHCALLKFESMSFTLLRAMPERIEFSIDLNKINRRQVAQRRHVAVTQVAVYVFAAGHYKSVKRRISLYDLAEVIVGRDTTRPAFVLKVRDDYDYHIQTDGWQELVEALADGKKELTGVDLPIMLLEDGAVLHDQCVSKDEAKLMAKQENTDISLAECEAALAEIQYDPDWDLAPVLERLTTPLRMNRSVLVLVVVVAADLTQQYQIRMRRPPLIPKRTRPPTNLHTYPSPP